MVFAINTKHHRDASIWVGDHVLRVNNANTHHLSAAHRDGADVSRRLSSKAGFPVPVRSVIAVLGSRSIVDRRSAHDRPVSVVDAERLAGWLVRQPRQLGEGQLGFLKLAAEEPETWHRDPRAADTLRVMQRFERLVTQVGMPRSPASLSGQPRKTAARPPRRTTSGCPSRAAQKPRRIRIGRLWGAVALVFTAVAILNVVAGEACPPSALVCPVPTMLAALGPLFVVGELVALVTGVIGTVLWALQKRVR